MTHTIRLLVLLLVAGCAKTADEPLLTATVTYGGEPLRGGRITLLNDKGIATASIGDDGRAELYRFPLGTSRVAVTTHSDGVSLFKTTPVQPPKPGQPMSVVPTYSGPELPARYADPAHSPVEVVVTRGQTELRIDLERRPDDPPVFKAADGPSVGIKVGQIAPDIVGDDTEGRPMKLSDYRGKVVVLLFWGHWCRLCREQYPHETALAARHEGKPFAIVGVNSDRERDSVAPLNLEAGIRWRSWWDGEQAGPVGRAWNIQGFPHTVIIDAQGVIRRVNAHREDLDRVVDDLLRTTP